MSRTTAAITALVTAVLVSAVSARAQDQPAGQFEGLIEVTEVFLDVLATDRKGNVVPGLGKDDFIIKEGNQTVEITSASFYTTRYAGDPARAAEPDTAAPELREIAPQVPSSRYFILFFHDQSRIADARNRLLRQQLDAARKAHDWVRDELSGSDWVAVLSYDVKLNVHQDFTQDLGSLVAAIDDAAIAKDTKTLPPSRRKRMTAGTAPSLLRLLPAGPDLGKETERIYDAIRLVAEASRPIVGRKNMMLFTIGFGEFDFGFQATRPDSRYYPQMEQALNDGNVAVYPIDLTPAEVQHAQSDFLSRLANDTGGYYHQNIVNFSTPLRMISEENTGYYLLSFRTEHPAGETGYREIKVKAKDRKIRIRTRRGYKYGVGG